MKVWLLLAVWVWWLKGESVAEPQAAAHLLFPFDGQFVRPPDDQRPAREGTHIPVILLVRRDARVLEPDLAWKKIAFSALDSLAYGFRDLSAVPREGGGIDLTSARQRLVIDPEHYELWLGELALTEVFHELELLVLHDDRLHVESATVYFDENATTRTYSLSVDDVIQVFHEVRRDRLNSLFEHHFFAWLRRLHQQTGVPISLYLFYEGLPRLSEGFELSLFPDTYRAEFEAHSGWLKLGFHAQAMDPPRPYTSTTVPNRVAEAAQDYRRIKREVERFAGESSWDPLMRSHYWSGDEAVVKAWMAAGAKGFYSATPQQLSSYYLEVRQQRQVITYDAWRDHRVGALFVQTDAWAERDFLQDLSDYWSPYETWRVDEKIDALLEWPTGRQDIHLFSHEGNLFYDRSASLRVRIEEFFQRLQARGYRGALAGDNAFLMHLPPLPPQPLSGQVSADGRFLELRWERRPDHAPAGWYEVACRTLEEDRLGAWRVIARPAETTFSWALEEDRTWLFRVRFQDPSGRWSPSSNVVGMSAEGPVTAVGSPAVALPGSFRLEQNVPNPFNATTTIRYTLAQAQPVELWLFNLAGQRVRRLAGGRQAAGEYQVTWDGRDEAGRPAATGIYFYRLEGTQSATRKLLLLR